MKLLLYSQLCELSAELGLNIVGVGKIHENPGPERWRSPQEIFPGLRSIISFAVPYDHSPVPPLKEGYGRIARFAWGRDYHIVLKELLTALVSRVAEFISRTPEFRIGVDSIPLLERGIAQQAGLGFAGKNSLLLRKGQGSYFFLGEILWDVEISGFPGEAEKESCGECLICKKACPVSAIRGDSKIDSSRCVSYLTIEKRGPLSADECEALGDKVFGCDICQECCPMNDTAAVSPALDAFRADAGVGPALPLESTLAIRDNSTFRKRFAGTSLLRAKREGLLRNCAAVAANTHAVSLSQALETAFREDSSIVIRRASFAALCKMQRECGTPSAKKIRHLSDLAEKDSIPEPDCAEP